MKHKHAELIIAWANGAKIQSRNDIGEHWQDNRLPVWANDTMYRIKPEPNPDFFSYLTVNHKHTGTQTLYRYSTDNVKFTYDGETGKLKSVELL
jgi:hypothetical protein